MDTVITKKEVEAIIEEVIGTRLTSIEDSMKDVSEIKRALLGDGIYTKVGMKEQHDEMYRAYFTYKEDLFPVRLNELWENYQNKKKNKLDEKVDEVVTVYSNMKWSLKLLGITSIMATITSIFSIITAGYAVLKLFGKI